MEENESVMGTRDERFTLGPMSTHLKLASQPLLLSGRPKVLSHDFLFHPEKNLKKIKVGLAVENESVMDIYNEPFSLRSLSTYLKYAQARFIRVLPHLGRSVASSLLLSLIHLRIKHQDQDK